MMPKMQRVAIVIQGLAEAPGFPKLINKWQERHDIRAIHHKVKWRDGEPFEVKLGRLIDEIDTYHATGAQISLIGSSAAAALGLLAYLARREKVHRVVSICGWIRIGHSRGYLEWCRRFGDAFVDSVLCLDARVEELTKEDRAKILIVRSFLDQIVRRRCQELEGVRVVVMPSPEHTIGIGMSLTTHARPLVAFIREDAAMAADR
ncbi:MAG: hypothetical protein Q7S95_04100 [bacterium]|nr:hypothetical protein [bacterium]